MQIIKLEVSNYKCLKDFSIDFTTDYEKGYSNTVLIGENGSGKSSIIEAITMILMSDDSLAVARQIDFSYILDYAYAGRRIALIYNCDENFYKVVVQENRDIIIDSTFKTTTRIKYYLRSKNIDLFPLNIITYYSGTDQRLSRLNRDRDRAYARKIHNFLEYRTTFHTRLQEPVEFPEKKYWYYCRDIAIPIMLALLLSTDDDAIRIRRKLNIRKIDSFQIEIDLRSLVRYTGTMIPRRESSQMEEFWNVLDALDIHICRNLERSEVLVTENFLIIRVNDFKDWHNNSYSILDFFDKLSLIFDVVYDLKVNVAGQPVDFFDLSEGQRQLVNALGLLTICKEQDSLVLMDEPDVYLNPKWKYEYLEYLKNSIQGAINTQILISTHDPLMINGLEKEYIRKLEKRRVRQGYKTSVYYPMEDTSGLGIDGLLQSGYYGLKTSYDSITSQKYQRRAELFSKLIHEELTSDEELELTRLTKELNGLPMMNTSIDYLYDDFMREYRQSKYYLEEYLTAKQVEEKNKYIAELIEKLFKNKG